MHAAASTRACRFRGTNVPTQVESCNVLGCVANQSEQWLSTWQQNARSGLSRLPKLDGGRGEVHFCTTLVMAATETQEI